MGVIRMEIKQHEVLGEPLSIPAAAQLIGVSKHTLRAWIRDRRFAHYRVGRRVVVHRTDVETFLARHRVDPTSPTLDESEPAA
jgi:excisionase family DNA binding protein